MVWTQHTHTHNTWMFTKWKMNTRLKYQWLLNLTYGSVPERICCTECWPLIIFINRIRWIFEDTPSSCRRISSSSSARISPVMPSFENLSLYCVRSIAPSRFCTCRWWIWKIYWKTTWLRFGPTIELYIFVCKPQLCKRKSIEQVAECSPQHKLSHKYQVYCASNVV